MCCFVTFAKHKQIYTYRDNTKKQKVLVPHFKSSDFHYGNKLAFLSKFSTSIKSNSITCVLFNYANFHAICFVVWKIKPHLELEMCTKLLQFAFLIPCQMSIFAFEVQIIKWTKIHHKYTLAIKKHGVKVYVSVFDYCYTLGGNVICFIGHILLVLFLVKGWNNCMQHI